MSKHGAQDIFGPFECACILEAFQFVDAFFFCPTSFSTTKIQVHRDHHIHYDSIISILQINYTRKEKSFSPNPHRGQTIEARQG